MTTPTLGRGALRRAACLVLALGAAAAPVHAAAPPPLDADFARLLAEEQLAGLVYATIDGDATQVGAVGLADVARAEPMRAEHRVLLGSVAKTVTALGVLRLVTQGRLDLDSPVDAVLPDLPIDNPWAERSPLRVRHLIDMTGGLDDIRLRHFFSTRNTPGQPLATAVDGDQRLLRLRTEPGRVFSYSNTSFHLAGMVIEAITGEHYEDFLDREVLQAIGMPASSTAFPDATRHAPLASGHLDAGEPILPIPVAVRPAAQFLTNAADMATLMRFLLGDGTSDGRVVIRSDLLRAMGHAADTDAARAGLDTGYGLGLFTRDRHGAVGRCHGGSIAGWRAMFCIYPDRGRGFFAAHNADHEGAAYDRFDARFVEHLGVARRVPPAPADAAPPDDRRWSGRYVPAPSRLSFATLADQLFGSWMLDLDAAPPSLAPASGPVRALESLGDRRYRQDDRVQATFALTEGADGTPTLSASYLTLRRISPFEFAALWIVTIAGVVALLYFLVAPLCRRRTVRGAWREPGFVGASVFGLGIGAVALQPWQQLGDPTPATIALALGSLALPFAAAWECLRAGSRRARPTIDGVRLAAGVSIIALFALLAAYGLWPILSWRL
ncbi:MAG: beta-lactamase family protein [Xanthomonadaceae bacterium]|jgi:CubicO group peptidase (beta-lactamase class C family)|nr:beta-lactamase family protein [Xanthomonadaceae bacterium]